MANNKGFRCLLLIIEEFRDSGIEEFKDRGIEGFKN